MNKKVDMKFIGDLSQIIDVKRFQLLDGREKGLECIEVLGDYGINFTVVVDRALDISSLRYMGKNISYKSPNGVGIPTYYAHSERSKEDNFFYGMLTTCGLENIGPESIVDGTKYLRHGSISNIPATDVSIEKGIRDGHAYVSIRGKIIQYLFNEYYYILHREIYYDDSKKSISINDKIENCKEKEMPVFIMYHYNFGYPFLDENVNIKIPSIATSCKNSNSEKHYEDRLKITAPDQDFLPQVFYHSFEKGSYHTVKVENIEHGIGVELGFEGTTLNYMNQWKMLADTEYVLALEPCSQLPYGRAKMLNDSELHTIKPYEFVEFKTELRMYSF